MCIFSFCHSDRESGTFTLYFPEFRLAAKPTRDLAPERRAIMELVVPPCKSKTRSGENERISLTHLIRDQKSPRLPGTIILSTAGLPRRTWSKGASTTAATWFAPPDEAAARAGVISKVSPRERSLIKTILLPFTVLSFPAAGRNLRQNLVNRASRIEDALIKPD